MICQLVSSVTKVYFDQLQENIVFFQENDCLLHSKHHSIAYMQDNSFDFEVEYFKLFEVPFAGPASAVGADTVTRTRYHCLTAPGLRSGYQWAWDHITEMCYCHALGCRCTYRGRPFQFQIYNSSILKLHLGKMWQHVKTRNDCDELANMNLQWVLHYLNKFRLNLLGGFDGSRGRGRRAAGQTADVSANTAWASSGKQRARLARARLGSAARTSSVDTVE